MNPGCRRWSALVMALVAAVATTLALTGCTADQAAAPGPSTSTVTVTATVGSTASATGTDTASEAPTAPPNTTVTSATGDPRDYADQGVPTALRGTWCFRGTTECHNLFDYLISHPTASFEPGSERDLSGRLSYTLCLEPAPDGSCSTAGSLYLAYLPAGTGWNCVREGAEAFGLSACRPDHTADHDPAEPRVVVLYNHQQDAVYHDSMPLYRATPSPRRYPQLPSTEPDGD